ncbi:MAG: cupin domain-containing protein [Bacteroidales bacterium]
MVIKDIRSAHYFVAGDGTRLCELLHPEREPLQLNCSVAYARLERGCSSKPHRLSSTEIYFIAEGEGIMHLDGESEPVVAGQLIYIPPGALQSISQRGESALGFLCIVDPAWRAEEETII